MHETPAQRVAELLDAEGRHERPVDLAVEDDRPGVAGRDVGDGDVHPVLGRRHVLVVGDRVAGVHEQRAAGRAVGEHGVERRRLGVPLSSETSQTGEQAEYVFAEYITL